MHHKVSPPIQTLKPIPITEQEHARKQFKVQYDRIMTQKGMLNSLLCRATSLLRVSLSAYINRLSFFYTGGCRLIWGECFLTNYSIYLTKDCLESLLHINSFECRGLDEWQAFPLRVSLGILCGDRSEMFQISLVPNKHDHNVGISMISQLLQPPADILKCCWFGHVVN